MRAKIELLFFPSPFFPRGFLLPPLFFRCIYYFFSEVTFLSSIFRCNMISPFFFVVTFHPFFFCSFFRRISHGLSIYIHIGVSQYYFMIICSSDGLVLMKIKIRCIFLLHTAKVHCGRDRRCHWHCIVKLFFWHGCVHRNTQLALRRLYTGL